MQYISCTFPESIKYINFCGRSNAVTGSSVKPPKWDEKLLKYVKFLTRTFVGKPLMNVVTRKLQNLKERLIKRAEIILIDESLFLVSNASLSLKSVLFKHFLLFIFLFGNVPILHGAKSGSFSIDRFHGLGAVAQASLLIRSSVSCVISRWQRFRLPAVHARNLKENHFSQRSQC